MRSAPVRIALWTCVAIAACEGWHRAPRDRFIPVADGVVLDSRTHLEWTSGDYAQSLAWDDADRLCRGSSRGGRMGWRLPQIGELQALYDERFDELCGDRHCHLDPAVRLGGPYVWSVSTRGGGTRFYFDFGFGTSLSPSIGPTLVRRVLCVHDVSTSTSVSDVPATRTSACPRSRAAPATSSDRILPITSTCTCCSGQACVLWNVSLWRAVFPMLPGFSMWPVGFVFNTINVLFAGVLLGYLGGVIVYVIVGVASRLRPDVTRPD